MLVTKKFMQNEYNKTKTIKVRGNMRMKLLGRVLNMEYISRLSKLFYKTITEHLKISCLTEETQAGNKNKVNAKLKT